MIYVNDVIDSNSIVKDVIDSNSIVLFCVVYGPEELEELAGMASAFILNHRRPFTYAHLLHRNKRSAYWREIFDRRGGIMEVYLKDSNGDQASPINNNIDGLFFSATIEASTGLPPKFSPFGNQRLEMPVQELCNENTNLYFADFYCNSAIYKHYITLVMTPKGSDADFFCANTLVPLDPLHNDFFSLESHMEGDMKGCPEPQLSRKDEFSYRDTLWDFAGGMQGCKSYTGFKCEEICCEDDWGLEKLWDEPTECVCVRVPRHANVEVLYTEDIDVGLALGRPGVSMYSVPSSGSSRPGGFPKNLDCPECSLSPYVHLFDLMVDFE